MDIANMTDEQKRVAIAKACGFEHGLYQGKISFDTSALHDYLNDLNAMHEAEQVLTDEQRDHYRWALSNLLEGWHYNKPEDWDEYVKHTCWTDSFNTDAVSATAAQRADAFLLTLPS